jgi:hypothetical protein
MESHVVEKQFFIVTHVEIKELETKVLRWIYQESLMVTEQTSEFKRGDDND